MFFQKSEGLGRLTGREGNPLLGILSWCSSFGFMESTACLSLAAAISCFPGRSERFYHPVPQPNQRSQSAPGEYAMSFLFSPLLLFPHFFQCNLTVTFLSNCAPSFLKGVGAEFCTPLTNMLSSSQLCTPYSGPQAWPLHWISYEKQLLPLCETLFLSFSSSSPLVL